MVISEETPPLRVPAHKQFAAIGAALFGFCSVVSAAPEAGDLASGVPDSNIIAAGVWSSPDGSTVTYEASFFAPYQSVTAADMLRWVPGGAALIPNERETNNQQSKRGFGSGGCDVPMPGCLSGKLDGVVRFRG